MRFEVRALQHYVLTFNTRSATDKMAIAVTRPSSLSIHQNLQRQPTSGQIVESANFAEAAGCGADGNELSQMMKEVRASCA